MCQSRLINQDLQVRQHCTNVIRIAFEHNVVTSKTALTARAFVLQKVGAERTPTHNFSGASHFKAFGSRFARL